MIYISLHLNLINEDRPKIIQLFIKIYDYFMAIYFGIFNLCPDFQPQRFLSNQVIFAIKFLFNLPYPLYLILIISLNPFYYSL